ncbi:hypothetical protein [Streptomyces sp. NPDC088261]|uniref:hypothetical protein n=1 Tax=Streptomyces sp. NPDC088261 TaxID=3365851 RepID=UPI003812E812
MVDITAQLLTRALHKAGESFAPNELAYLALTSKPEHPLRDRMAWVLHTGLPGCIAAREWSPHGDRARTDLAILDESTHEALALVETKAAYTFDFAQEGRQTVDKYMRYVADDLAKARAAGGSRTRVFALLLLTHPASAPVQLTPVVKYGPEIARSLCGRSATDLADTAREIVCSRLNTMGSVTDGTLPAGTAFGIDVAINYFLVSAQ